MILPLNLNRRHKVTLFLSVVLAGIAALNSAKMMEVAGILLLGLALAWAFGSDSRIVHWLFLTVGALLTCLTVGGAAYLYQSDANLYAQKVAAFEQRMPELAKKHPLHKEGQVALDKDLPETFSIPKPVPGTYEELPSSAKNKPLVPSAELSKSAPATAPRERDEQGNPVQAIAPSVREWDAAGNPVTASQPRKPKHGPWEQYQSDKQRQRALANEFEEATPIFSLMMPDGHTRYFARERDANECQEYFFFWGKTQKMWNEAWVAVLDLSEVDLLEAPGYPPTPPWEQDASLVCLCLGVTLFALGLGLILGIRPKPLPT